MIQCKICRASFNPGTLFCLECGHTLFKGTALAEGTLPLFNAQIHYLLPESGRRGALSLTEPIWVGRADPEQGFWPSLDLTDDNGLTLGVSRRHALIESSEDGVTIIDQGSSNGTWMDQEKLTPDHPYPLPNTTIVRFGRLVVHFFIG